MDGATLDGAHDDGLQYAFIISEYGIIVFLETIYYTTKISLTYPIYLPIVAYTVVGEVTLNSADTPSDIGAINVWP